MVNWMSVAGYLLGCGIAFCLGYILGQAVKDWDQRNEL